MIEKLYKIIFTICISLIFLIFPSRVSALYDSCNKPIIGTNYYDCGNQIYTYYEDKEHSSIIYSLDENASIIYAGEEEGMSVFFASKMRFYNKSYDDRGFDNNNLWTVITTKGKEVFNGEFKDTLLLDDSHEDFYFFTLKREVYTFRQYANNGRLHRTIVIFNVDKDMLDIDNVKYDDTLIYTSSQNVLITEKGINGEAVSKYGIKSVTANINGNNVDVLFDGRYFKIESNQVNIYLNKGEDSSIEITATNYLGGAQTKKYKVKLVTNNVAIKFSTMTSVVESTSRRIVIDAQAGLGKKLDKDYCWYYWSTSGDDSLSYDDFLLNYANSDYKGSYSEDKGVILRNTTGTYYLYALAKDDDSWVVEKSEGYVLNSTQHLSTFERDDVIIVAILALLTLLPVVIYMGISKKGY